MINNTAFYVDRGNFVRILLQNCLYAKRTESGLSSSAAVTFRI